MCTDTWQTSFSRWECKRKQEGNAQNIKAPRFRMHLSVNLSNDYIWDAHRSKTQLCDHLEGQKPLHCTPQQLLGAPPEVWRQKALVGTGRSAVHLTVLHPALFDHGYMFLEKGHRHEQIEEYHQNQTYKFQCTYPNLWCKLHEDLLSHWSFWLLYNDMDRYWVR